MIKVKTMLFILLLLAATTSLAYSQQEKVDQKTVTISGVVAKMDAVGSVIEVRPDQGGETMAFSIPADVIITQGTETIGLLDIEESDPVTVEYYSPAPGAFIAVSITYNDNP